MSKLSAESFLHQIESGKRTTDAMRVYNLTKKWGSGILRLRDYQRKLDLSHGTSTARLSELCDLGIIYEDDSGHFHITPPEKIGEYAAMREVARYKKWRKLGEKNGWFGQMRIV